MKQVKTLKDFYTFLQAISGWGWELNEYGEIRCSRDHSVYCPLTAVNSFLGGEKTAIEDYELAGEQLGLNEDRYEAIVNAADEVDSGRPAIRKAMLKSLGLEGK